MRRAAGTLLLTLVILGGATTAAVAAKGPPTGGCPPAGGWELVLISEHSDAPVEADINNDLSLCRKDVVIPAFPGSANYVDNVLKITSGS